MNAAMMYMAAAFENCREDADEPNGTYANHAKDILWMLVNRGYNMPITSRLLSGIYLRQKNKKEYALLKELVGENNVVSEPEKLFDMELRKKDSVADIMHIAGTMFDAALMDACPIFNNENNAILALRNYFNENNLYKKNDVKKEVQRWQQAVYLCLNKQILDWVAIWNIDQGIMLDSISRLKVRINKFIEEMKQPLSSPMLQAETVGKMIERCRARFIVILKSAAVPGKLNEDDFSDLDNKLFQLRIRTAQYIGKKLIFNVSNVKTPMGGIIDYFNKMICYSSPAPEDAWDKGLDTALKNKSTFIINGDKFKEVLEGEKIKELVKKVKEKAMATDDNEKIIVYTQDDRLNPSEIQDLRNRLGDYVKYFFARMFNSQIRDFRQKYDKAQWRIGIFPSKIIISYNYDRFGE